MPSPGRPWHEYVAGLLDTYAQCWPCGLSQHASSTVGPVLSLARPETRSRRLRQTSARPVCAVVRRKPPILLRGSHARILPLPHRCGYSRGRVRLNGNSSCVHPLCHHGAKRRARVGPNCFKARSRVAAESLPPETETTCRMLIEPPALPPQKASGARPVWSCLPQRRLPHDWFINAEIMARRTSGCQPKPLVK